MTHSLLAAFAVTVAVGLLGAVATLRLARHSVRWAVLLSPVVVVLAMAAGLLVGVQRMLVSSTGVLIAILGAVAPVAIIIGAVVSGRVRRQVSRSEARLAAEQRRRAVEDSRRELITWMSHDLRTPLAGITAMAEALQDGVAADPPAYYRRITAAAERTSGMVSDLMALASLQSAESTLQREPVVIADITSDLIEQMQPLARARDVVLDGHAAALSAEVDGDAMLLSRAIQNIMANAISYTRPGTTVTVTVHSTGEAVTVAVSDACGGLSTTEVNRMFDPGWRGDAARTDGASAGSGFGMAIVDTIVAAHNGTVAVANRGTGCEVTISLPQRRSAAAPPQPNQDDDASH